MSTTEFEVWTRPVPGARMSVVARVGKMRDATAVAKAYNHRRDLTYQDVEIRKSSTGKRVRFAGPAR